jgi:catalase
VELRRARRHQDRARGAGAAAHRGAHGADRNPDNFFAETEQIAFCTQHIIPGIDFTNDPLLQGRNFSYLDTQLTRLGGPNFAQIPINMPIAQVHNNQRDGFHQHQIHRGRANYEPNSLGGGCPFQAGAAGFSSFAEKLMQTSREAEPAKLRAKPEKFAEHYAQATLFFNSQSPIEQQHIIDAFRFELTRVQTEAIRERVVAQLRNVDEDLARGVADGLGMERLPAALPLIVPKPDVEVTRSPALSLLARPGDGSIRTRRIALLVADGMDITAAAALYDALTAAGALPRYVGRRLGRVRAMDGDETLPVEVTLEAAPGVLWDALVLPAGDDAAQRLVLDDHAIEFVMQHWRHNKAMLLPFSAEVVLDAAGISLEDESDADETFDEEALYDEALEGREAQATAQGDMAAPATGKSAEDAASQVDADLIVPGVLVVPDEQLAASADRFIELVAQHRAYDRFDGNEQTPSPGRALGGSEGRFSREETTA